MERHGRLIRWTGQIGLMKINGYIIVLLLLIVSQGLYSQNYRTDSLQFKMYTRMYVNDQLGIDSIVVKKVFCDYCSERQLEILNNEAYRRTIFEKDNPKYKKPGEHRLALYVRFSKEDFKALNQPHE